LKDKLGIPHRRDRRKGDPEHVPMFESQYHDRSVSELSETDIEHSYVTTAPDTRGLYAPAGTASPPEGPTPRTNATFSDIPPGGRTPPHVDIAPDYVLDDGDDWDTVTPIQRAPPPEPPMSRVSYYSVSDLPPPSPFPESNIYSPTSSRPVTMTSVATSPVTQDYRSTAQLHPPSHAASPPHSPHARGGDLHTPRSGIYPGAAAYPGEYEMRVRSPSRSPNFDRAASQASHITEQSETSFFTAREGSGSDPDHGDFDDGTVRHSYDDDRATITQGTRVGDHDPWRESGLSQASEYTVSGPHAL